MTGRDSEPRRYWRIAVAAAIAALVMPAALAATDPAVPDYRNPASWAARPGAPGVTAQAPANAAPGAADKPVDVFYVHPTTYRSTTAFNIAMSEETLPATTDEVMARQAGVFNACCRIFAPWYRQASSRAFADRTGAGDAAYAFAYEDVLRAFDDYLAHDNHGRPFILVGHSQGALHVLSLLHDRIAGRPVAGRMVAAYVIGLGVPVGDFAKRYRGLSPCATPSQTGCMIAWEAFTEGSDAATYRSRNSAAYVAQHPGDAAGAELVCVNPLTFDAARPAAPASASKGALPIGPGFTPALVSGMVSARCVDGVLFVESPASLGLAPLPGGLLHFHDLALFYADIRASAAQRIAAWTQAHRR